MGGLAKVHAKQAPAMLALVGEVQDGGPATTAAIAELRVAKDVLATNKAAAVAAAEAGFRKHVVTLNERRQAVVVEIGTVADAKRKVLDDRINALEALESTAENGAVLAACVLEHGSVAEVLVLQPSIRGGVGDVVALHARLLAPTHISTHLQFADTMPELGAALEGFGAVNGDEVDLAQCTVAGEGLGLRGALMVNAEVAFSVDVVDGNGAAVPNPTALVRAMLVRKGGGGAAAAASSPPPTITVATVEEGRCVCTYTAPATVGAWSLEVQVGSEHLGGSPFAVEVVSLFQFSGIKIEQDNPYRQHCCSRDGR